nr:glutamate mutase L [Candidatus Njordarchaeum guaymaensis]
AGAIVMDVMAVDDGRRDYQKIDRLRVLRPDMILLAGGTDGGAVKLVMEIAEVINAAKPKPRFGVEYKLPLVFAGNKLALPEVSKLFDEQFALSAVENVRPTLEKEVVEPTRTAIHELFMEHVMSHAPGYTKLMKWTSIDIMPTPAGEGKAIQLIANAYGANVLGVGLGGATTNVYSVFEGKFVRSVSANLGMSYSICNVLKEAGLENIIRWVPFDVEDTDLENQLYNKMIRPTTIPQTLEDLIVEHAVAREALRLGLEHHKTIATRLKGVKIDRDVGEVFSQAMEETYIRMMDFQLIAGTGGLLSHAPRRIQSLLILTDAFQPEGVTRLFQDSVFMMPHLGVLSTVYPEAAWNIFDKDCLVRLGTIIAPVGKAEEGEHIMDVKLEMLDGSSVEERMEFGQIKKIPLQEQEQVEAMISPHRGFDVGAGLGNSIEIQLSGGIVGIVIDARGRPISLPEEKPDRNRKLKEWISSLDLYPQDQFRELLGD